LQGVEVIRTNDRDDQLHGCQSFLKCCQTMLRKSSAARRAEERIEA
jgi:hypothetical protein